ncbi:hypothetical protein AGMMS50276_24420 [Synergistales bacterium]|nr:hypothetical protein AGMMS50276_24420 [Synergistales bacterium]
MVNISQQKLKRMTQLRIVDVPLLSSYLEKMGISRNLQQYYLGSGWLDRIGHGAYLWPGDKLDWQGIVNSLQSQLDLPVHIGAMTALSFAGYSHYLRITGEKAFLFSGQKRDLPGWARSQPCSQNLSMCFTKFLSDDTLGIVDVPHKTFALRASCPERAILETLYLTPKNIDYAEAYQLMENLATLRPKILQELLENCGSVKVKRLFLLFSGESGHAWAKRLDKARIDIGSGIRSLAKDGVYVQEYHLVIPRELRDLWH